MEDKLSAGAFEVKQLIRPVGPIGKTKFWAEAKAGRIKVRYIDSKPIVLEDEWREYLKSLPTASDARRRKPPRRGER